MTDLDERPPLIPNADPAVAALSEVDGRIDAIAAESAERYKSVSDTPSEGLASLAWEASVDVWGPSWSDDRKRRVVRAAPVVHARKGTVAAVRATLTPLGVRVALEEWWQTTPRGTPYTFNVIAYVAERYRSDAPLITPELTADVLAAIRATVPLSRGFSFTIGAGFSGEVGAATVGSAVAFSRQFGFTAPHDDPFSEIGAAAVASAVQVLAAHCEASDPTWSAGPAGVAAVASALLVLHARIEASPVQ